MEIAHIALVFLFAAPSRTMFRYPCNQFTYENGI